MKHISELTAEEFKELEDYVSLSLQGHLAHLENPIYPKTEEGKSWANAWLAKCNSFTGNIYGRELGDYIEARLETSTQEYLSKLKKLEQEVADHE